MKTPHTIDDTQTLELLEERAEVQKQRVNTGKVILSKKIHTRTVNIPITLTEEHLVITYQQDDASLATHEQLSNDDDLVNIIDNTKATHAKITINGQVCSLTPDTPIEMLLYCETATVTKTAHAIEDIHLNTQTIQREHVFTTKLQTEVLDIQEGENLVIQNDDLDYAK